MQVSNEVAAALGLRSVRKLLVSGQLKLKDLSCPAPYWIAKQLAQYADPALVAPMLLDLADSLGAQRAQLLFDFRTHSAESILQPNLATLQGPAVLLYLDGVKLGAEQLCRLQNLPPHQHGLPRHCRAGPGLLSIYALADVACIVSGEALYYFDPHGSHFVDTEQRGARPVGKAHLFVNSDMPIKFADQFAPFCVFGFNPSRGFDGTLIRLPLKPSLCETLGSDIDNSGAQGSQRGEALRKLLQHAVSSTQASSLLFLECLEDISVSNHFV